MMLKEFFVDENIIYPFKLFGKTHLFLIIFVILGLFIIYKNRVKIYNLPIIIKRKITKVLAFLFIFNMIVLYVSSFYYYSFDYKTMLPLHLCYLANYFYIFVILFNLKKLYPYIYFLVFLGPIPAIIFFDVPSVWESFNFYLYIISHHLLVLAGLFTFYLYPQKMKVKYVIKLFIVLNFLYILISIFNYYFGTNYFFSKGIPTFILNLFPFLNLFPTMFILEVMELFLMWILFRFYKREESLLKL